MEISKFNNWFKEFGWRHLVALIFVVFAIYPILYVLTNSFADFARKKQMNVYDISKALGHSSIAITEAYLSSFDETTLDNEMQRIFE